MVFCIQCSKKNPNLKKKSTKTKQKFYQNQFISNNNSGFIC